jgi:hypothetical protein
MVARLATPAGIPDTGPVHWQYWTIAGVVHRLPVSRWLAWVSVSSVPGLLQGWLAFAPVLAGVVPVLAGVPAVYRNTCKFERFAGVASARCCQPSMVAILGAKRDQFSQIKGCR